MTPHEAAERLGVAPTADHDMIRRRFQEQYSDLRVLLSSAPTAALKRTYQKNLQELREAFETLCPGEDANRDFPSAEPIGPERNEKQRVGETPAGYAQATGDVSESVHAPSRRRRWAWAAGATALLILVVLLALRELRDRNMAPIARSLSIEIATEPIGAELFVDGVVRGNSPVRVEGLTEGAIHEVRAVLPGHAAWKQQVQVTAAAPLLTIRLEPIGNADEEPAAKSEGAREAARRPDPIAHQSAPRMADHPAHSSSFIRSLGGVLPKTVRQLRDRGYLVASYIPPERAILSRLNESGTLLWSMDLEIHDLDGNVALAEFPDGSVLVGVGDEDVRILNLSKDGAIVWQTQVPWPGMDYEAVIAILPLNAGGLIFVGAADSADRGNGFCGWHTLFLGRLSQSGKKIWLRTYAALPVRPTLAVALSSDDKLVIGYDMQWKDDRLDRCVTRPGVVEVDLEGNVERFFVPELEPQFDTRGAIAVFASPDGAAWLLGDTRFGGYELGAFVAHGSIGSEASVQPLDLSATQEHGEGFWAKGIINAIRQGERTIVLSWMERRRKHGPNVQNNNTYWLTSFDRAFQVQWTDELTETDYEARYENLAPTADGGIVLIGTRLVEGGKLEGFLEKRTAHGTH